MWMKVWWNQTILAKMITLVQQCKYKLWAVCEILSTKNIKMGKHIVLVNDGNVYIPNLY